MTIQNGIGDDLAGDRMVVVDIGCVIPCTGLHLTIGGDSAIKREGAVVVLVVSVLALVLVLVMVGVGAGSRSCRKARTPWVWKLGMIGGEIYSCRLGEVKESKC